MRDTHGGTWGICLLFFLLFCCTSPVLGQGKEFSPGETLHYQVFTKGLPIGEQILRIRRENMFQARQVLEIEMSLRSYAAYALFYSYEEENLLYLDAQAFTPVYLKKAIKEKDRSWEEEYLFGAETVEKRVIVPGMPTRITTYEAKHPLLESLSLIYFLRNRPWREGQNQVYFLTSKGPQAIVYQHQGKERIRVFDDYQWAEVMHDPISRVKVWFSQTEPVYPLRIQVTANLGVLTARLVKIDHCSGNLKIGSDRR
ncbi:MAG: DUF3108 domain-containing protein [Firmicutes bacterium]|nr:DUF3108 domain-containing protein [Bacillota bacterium]